MTAVIDVLEDNLNNCFEPREENSVFSDVSLRSRQASASQKYQDESSIIVTVGSPEKHSTFRETYIRYLVKSHSSREEFMNQHYEVFRRYNDFLWLRDRLEDTKPTMIIPPFPPKHSINSLDRFSGPFIIARCEALGSFVNRVCAHPVLSSTDDLFHFLTIRDDQAWLAYKREHAVGLELAKKMKSIVQVGEENPEFMHFIPKLDNCRDGCQRFISTSRILMDEEHEAAVEMLQLSNSLSKWSSESGHLPHLGSTLYNIGQILEIQSQELASSSHSIQTRSIAQFGDLIAYSECARKVVVRRDKLQGSIRDLSDTAVNVERSIGAPNSLSRTLRRESVDEERRRKESRLTELRSRSDSLSGSLETANSDLRSEYDRWETHRSRVLRTALVDHAAQRVALHRGLEQHWTRLMAELRGSPKVQPQA